MSPERLHYSLKEIIQLIACSVLPAIIKKEKHAKNNQHSRVTLLVFGTNSCRALILSAILSLRSYTEEHKQH